MKFKKITYTK